ncbi:hypothetical protein A2U01_0119123, partial [Trifolium medium]|nr:hypothetical protein [Trifolium medium]
MNLRGAQMSETILCSILDDRRDAPLLPARRASSRDFSILISYPGATRQYPLRG